MKLDLQVHRNNHNRLPAQCLTVFQKIARASRLFRGSLSWLFVLGVGCASWHHGLCSEIPRQLKKKKKKKKNASDVMTHGRQGACTLHQFAARARIRPRSPEVTSQVIRGRIAAIGVNRQRKHAPWMQFDDAGNRTNLLLFRMLPPPPPPTPLPSLLHPPPDQSKRQSWGHSY